MLIFIRMFDHLVLIIVHCYVVLSQSMFACSCLQRKLVKLWVQPVHKIDKLAGVCR